VMSTNWFRFSVSWIEYSGFSLKRKSDVNKLVQV